MQLSFAALSFEETLTADFSYRDQIVPSTIPPSQWYDEKLKGTWGPKAIAFPEPIIPNHIIDPIFWKRCRVVAVAKRYVGLAYRHHHIPHWNPPSHWPSVITEEPECAGLDCSNFISWIYNYGLGIQFASKVKDMANSVSSPGRIISPVEPLEKGDLLFLHSLSMDRISHVCMYIGNNEVIDSSFGRGVTIRPLKNWYKTHVAFVRRIIEPLDEIYLSNQSKGILVSTLQKRLLEMNIYTGEATGILDGETLSAINQFQKRNNLGITKGGINGITFKRVIEADSIS